MTSLPEKKKITKCPKASVVYTYSNRSKNSLMKLLSFRKQNGIPIFWEPPRELMKIAFKNRTVREITAFGRGEGNDFWFELSGGSKN